MTLELILFMLFSLDKAQIKQNDKPFVEISSNVCIIYIPIFIR